MRLEQIKQYVEEATGLEDISTRKRTNEYALARAVYFKLAKEKCTSSFYSIGKAVKRHHSSVSHNINNVCPSLEKYYPLYYDIYKDFDEYKQRKKLAESFNINPKLSKIIHDFDLLDDDAQECFRLRAEAVLKMIK